MFLNKKIKFYCLLLFVNKQILFKGSGHDVADTILKGVRRLYDDGARNFALVNVPAVVITPRAINSIGKSGVKFEGIFLL